MVETPHLSIDGAKMKKNIEKMAAIAARNGVALRPHVKTHKIPTLAWAQVEAGATGITVAKVSEAEVMADAGLEDIFIAYPLVTASKIRRAVELRRKLQNLIVGVEPRLTSRMLIPCSLIRPARETMRSPSSRPAFLRSRVGAPPNTAPRYV